jgi:hypothetical protein
MSKTSIKVKSGVRAGGLGINHNRSWLKVRAGIRAAGLGINHNRTPLSA